MTAQKKVLDAVMKNQDHLQFYAHLLSADYPTLADTHAATLLSAILADQ